MGNISNKFSLVAAGHVQFVRHIIQGKGQIPQLVFLVQGYIVLQIPGSEGVCSLNDLFQRPVDHEGKYRNNHSQDYEKNKEQNIDDIQDIVPFSIYDGHGKMDGHISFHPHIYSNRYHDA